MLRRTASPDKGRWHFRKLLIVLTGRTVQISARLPRDGWKSSLEFVRTCVDVVLDYMYQSKFLVVVMWFRFRTTLRFFILLLYVKTWQFTHYSNKSIRQHSLPCRFKPSIYSIYIYIFNAKCGKLRHQYLH